MRAIVLVIVFFSLEQTVFCQQHTDSAHFKHTFDLLKQQNIRLRHLVEYDGFAVHYNCDSIPFRKKRIGDTIKIWTESANFAMDPSALNKYTLDETFAKTVYVKEVLSDGRVTISGMHQTVFIFRNDSLYEIESGYEEEGPKLIFHPKMFSSGKTRIKVGKKYNYLRDQIVLERAWTEKGKKL